MGAIFASTRFSLVRIFVRDLVADGKSSVRSSGVGGGGLNRILISEGSRYDFVLLSSMSLLSGPVSRDTARLSQRYPPIARYGVLGVSTWPIGCDTPPPFSERFPIEEHSRSGGTIPPVKRGISAIPARYPMKTRQMGEIPPSAILSRKGIARYGGVSRTGPLSVSPLKKDASILTDVRSPGEFQVTVCGVTVGPFSRHKGNQRPKCL